MEALQGLSQDSVVVSSTVVGENFPRFEILANGKIRYGDGTKAPSGTSPVTVKIPKLDNDEFGNPKVYDTEGNVIYRNSEGFIEA